MALTPSSVIRTLVVVCILASMPALAARKQNAGSSQNGETTPVPNCPNSSNTPNFAVLDGSAINCSVSVPLGNRVITLTDPANTFTVTITPALWLFESGSFGANTIFNVHFKNLSSSKTLTLKFLAIGAALAEPNYVECNTFATLAGSNGSGGFFTLHDANGTSFCMPPLLTVPKPPREVLEPTPIPAADFSDTRWDFDNLTATLGETSSTLSLTVDCIPQEFAPDYTDSNGNGPCVNNLVLPGGTGTATQFQVLATDGAVNYFAGALQLAKAPPATNDTYKTATPITTTLFTDFINTSGTNPSEILSGNDAGGENNPQGDPPPPCSPYPNRVFRSVWYTFTPSDDRIVNISTAGSRYDTLVYVFTGSPSNPTPVACNDDSTLWNNPSLLRYSDISFTPIAGTQYYIMVSETPPDVGTEFQNGVQVLTAQPLAGRPTLTFNLNRGNPVPFIDAIYPVAAAPGTFSTIIPELIITGTGFASGAKVNFGDFGVTVNPTSFAPGQIIVNDVILSSPLGQFTYTVPITVTNINASPFDGTSNVTFLPVTSETTSVSMFDNDYPTTSGGGFPLLADLNNDGILDLVIPNIGTSALVFLGNGDGSFQTEMPASTGNGAVAAMMGDFNGDSKVDLATANAIDGTASILLGNGDGTFQNPLSVFSGRIPDGVAAGDFNRDGNLDLAVVNSGDDTVSILLGDGTGNLELSKTYSTGFTPTWVLAGDFNGDGKIDLVTVDDDSSWVSVFLGNGDGTFQTAVPYETDTAPLIAVAGDFNGDGKLDLASANEGGGNVSVLIGNGDGTFQTHVDYPIGTLAESVVTGDFNGDGKLDLAVVPLVSQCVFILLGNGDGTFQAAVPNCPTGVSQGGLAIGDLNNDGMMDLVTPTTTGYSVLLQQSDALSFSRTSVDFGTQEAGTRSAEQDVSITNAGDRRLDLSIAASGNFTQTNNCGRSIAPRSSCQVSISFAPTSVDNFGGAIRIRDNATSSSRVISLAGTGSARAVQRQSKKR
jgi:hypothetical protein